MHLPVAYKETTRKVKISVRLYALNRKDTYGSWYIERRRIPVQTNEIRQTQSSSKVSDCSPSENRHTQNEGNDECIRRSQKREIICPFIFITLKIQIPCAITATGKHKNERSGKPKRAISIRRSSNDFSEMRIFLKR